MLAAEYETRVDEFTNLLGQQQVKIDTAAKWGYATTELNALNMRVSFIYLNILSRYTPGGSNNITDLEAEYILTQLGKLLPC
jgi:hypothetical protein